ncbi:carbon-nitrogen hydrolase family protein [Paenarthrobacter sp. RAF54_2]|uniref:carbon-nitrogen hydrolase family protein n=1 Tax=Paenarthrobacter sp. RAF54_2 TaxID=3233061 RepID=UPI003F98A2AF
MINTDTASTNPAKTVSPNALQPPTVSDTTRIVGVAQIGAQLADPAANAQMVEKYLIEASAKGVSLIVFPECSLTGYMFESRAEVEAAALSLNHPVIERLTRRCAQLNITAIVGTLEREKDKVYNAALVLGPTGLIGVHRKRHLPFLGADRFVDEPAGTETAIFNTPAGRVGVAICYEIRFPEITRTLTLAGAEIVALPTCFAGASHMLAEDFTRVRAAENFVWFLAANRNDTEGWVDFMGRSSIVDPLGKVIADAGKDSTLLTASIDLERARDKTLTFRPGEHSVAPWADRRPATYRI